MAIEQTDTSAAIQPGRWWQQFRRGWSDALRWPVFAWLNPVEPVRIIRADAQSDAHRHTPSRARATALVVPDSIVLRSTQVLPSMAADDFAAAIALQATELSPFDDTATVHGWQAHMRADGQLEVAIAIASRAHVASQVAARVAQALPPQASHLKAPQLKVSQLEASQLEIWADGHPAIVFRGFGESARLARQHRHRRQLIAMLLTAAALGAALAVAPVLTQSQQLAHAQRALQALQSETRSIVDERESLVRTNDKLQALTQALAGDVDVPMLLESLTRVLPDDAYLQRLEVSDRQVRMAGFSDDAAQLIDRLGMQPGFIAVRTPSPISRGRDGRESFSVEFTLHGAPVDRSE